MESGKCRDGKGNANDRISRTSMTDGKEKELG